MNTERPDWSSFHRLVQDLLNGVVRRHTFTQWELELLLDLQNAKLRKGSRDAVLKRYLRLLLQSHAEGAEAPPRLCTFLETRYSNRSAAVGG